MGVEDTAKQMGPLKTKLFNLVARAVVKLVDDSTLLQLLQIEALDGEVHDDVPRFQQYGFNSRPFAGTEAIVLCLNGDRAQAVAIAVDDPGSRPADFEEGETGLYTDEDNSDSPTARFFYKLARGMIHLFEGAKIKLGNPAATPAPTAVELCGHDQHVVLETKLKSYIDSQIRATYNGHTHLFGTLAAPPGGGTCTGATDVPSATIPAAGDISAPNVKAGA